MLRAGTRRALTTSPSRFATTPAGVEGAVAAAAAADDDVRGRVSIAERGCTVTTNDCTPPAANIARHKAPAIMEMAEFMLEGKKRRAIVGCWHVVVQVVTQVYKGLEGATFCCLYTGIFIHIISG